MKLPDDLERWLDTQFSATDAGAARAMLEAAVDHAGQPASDRLLRCAALGSRGKLDQVKYLVDLLKTDSRDVIVFGEYEPRGGQLVRVRDLSQPIP